MITATRSRTTVLATLTLFAAVLMLGGCSRQPKLHDLDGFAEGTSYHITWWSRQRVSDAVLSQEFDAVIAQIDKRISTYTNDSDLQAFNRSRSTKWQSLPASVIHLLTIAKTVYHDSNRCYDPTVGPLFDLWGFQTAHPHIPSAQEIAAVKKGIGFDHVTLDVAHDRLKKSIPKLGIDLSSMGEGYTIWHLSRVLERHGIHNYIVEFGGDMLVKGHKPGHQKWRIAIAQPVPGKLAPERIVTIENEKGVSVNTSGTYRRFFDADGKSYSHILDPRTGRPVTHNLVSATVFNTDPRVGDAWATAMLCMGKEEGERVARKAGIKVYFIQDEGDKLVGSESPALRRAKAVTIDKFRPSGS